MIKIIRNNIKSYILYNNIHKPIISSNLPLYNVITPITYTTIKYQYSKDINNNTPDL